MNSRGEVVGYGRVGTFDVGSDVGFVWNERSGYRYLTATGSSYTYGFGINEQGVAVGGAVVGGSLPTVRVDAGRVTARDAAARLDLHGSP